MADYNVLEGSFNNSLFDVKFDLYTPRPHFILLTKESEIEFVNPNFSSTTNEQKQELIKSVKSVMELFKIDGGILSIHLGAWRSQKEKLHVHFCVNVDSYLKAFNSQKYKIPKWPNKQFVTKEWIFDKCPHKYADNVRHYPYRSYLKKELQDIKNGKCPETKISAEKIPLEGGISRIVFHHSHPKIGFVGAKSKYAENLQRYLSAMEKFAEELSLTDVNGCHVCLYLDTGTYIASFY